MFSNITHSYSYMFKNSGFQWFYNHLKNTINYEILRSLENALLNDF